MFLAGLPPMKIFMLVALAAACISLPISNLLTKRTFIEITTPKANDPEFVKFSKQLQISCANCHTPNFGEHPFYSRLPIAQQLIAYDIKEAQKELVLDLEKLNGRIDFTPKDLKKIKKEIQDDEMPPLQYKIIHWEGLISSAQKQIMLDYINRLSKSK